MGKTVYLLQHTKELNEELKEQIERGEEFEVVGASVDGVQAVKEIRLLEPEFLLTGLVLGGEDGISVIKKVREMKPQTKIIVVSALMCEEIVASAINSGADYFMGKPLNVEILKERMKEMCLTAGEQDIRGNREKESVDERISRIFINVGIPPHIKGYTFLREGVKMAINEPNVINNVTKKLYPSIGEKFETTPSKVERAIRHAIEVAWNRGRIENINKILGARAYMGAEKPTNSEFIALVADKMILERA